MYRLWKRIMALETRMAVWRKIMKPVYDNAVELKSGGELVIVARKMEEIF
jgi:hypothetical protein